MILRRALIPVHRWLSLALLLFWSVQALTGIVCVFHWELDDATVAGAHRPTDLHAIERRLDALAPPGSGRRVTSLWTSAGKADRWDATLDGPDGGASVRLDGAGDVLRVRRDGERFAHGGWLDTIVVLHQTLLAGDLGGWIVGVSGILLLSNIVMGLMLAWPRARLWRQSLRPPRGGKPPARLYGWHRAAGLWAGVPALLLFSAGVLRVFSDGFEHLIGAPAVSAPAEPPRGGDIGFARAATAALRPHPGARLAGVAFPSADDATWRIRVTVPGEAVRAYGQTTVFVSGNDGHVVADYPALTAPLSRRVANQIYPLHTGEWAGLVGRLGVLAIGTWLASMIGLGASLWWTRRRPRRRTPA